MNISLISFTTEGNKLSGRISKMKLVFGDEEVSFVQVFSSSCRESSLASRKTKKEISLKGPGLKEYIGKCFKRHEPLVFIGACGIAVRLIAPFINDKLSDIPVLVIDEKGKHVIPVLSGHYGGGNELALKMAKFLKADPVITTATDLNNAFAVDIFARKNHLNINDKKMIAYVSSKILSGEKVTFKTCSGISFDKSKLPDELEPLPDKTLDVPDILVTDNKKDKDGKLILTPKCYALGIGCKKGTKSSDIEKFVLKILKDNDIPLSDVFSVSSIDLKKNEEGLKEFCGMNRIGFVTYSPDELMKVKGDFTSSEFVRSKTGADNVCERASVKACGRGGELVVSKRSSNGITVAVSKRKVRLSFDV